MQTFARVLGTSERGVRERIGQARSRIIGQNAAAKGDASQPLLSAYMDHQLSGDDHIAVQQHLATCAKLHGAVSAACRSSTRRLRTKRPGPSASVAYDVTRILRGEKLPTGQDAAGRVVCWGWD